MNYPIKATFIDEITYDIPSQNYDKEMWIKELDYMKSVGIDTVVFIRGYFYEKCLFPSKNFKSLRTENEDDLPEIIFSEADKKDMKVYMGMYIKDITWNNGDYKNEIEMNKIFVDEVIERYNHHKSFYGWYIPHEVGNNVLNIIPIFKELSKLVKEKTPEKKVLVSPFFLTKEVTPVGTITPDEVYKEWDYIFKESGEYIDYCAFQDGSAPLNQMIDYFKAAKKAFDNNDVELWSNVELMGRNMVGFNPIEFQLLKRKIEDIKPYVSNFMTFEFSHFLSPQSNFESARNLFKQYKEYYKK